MIVLFTKPEVIKQTTNRRIENESGDRRWMNGGGEQNKIEKY